MVKALQSANEASKISGMLLNREPDDRASHTETPLQERLGHELLKTALFLLFVIIPIRFFVLTPFIVSGSSMDPTFENGDYLIIDQLSMRFGDPDRYDVIVFRYPYNPSKYFIKRVIGLPGEHVVIANGSVTVFNEENPDGLAVPPPSEGFATTGNVDITLGENEYFVMGDNRDASSDSRAWGPLNRTYIVGTPLVRLLPPGELGFSPGSVKSEEQAN
jgi:signal peptidase I